MSKNYSTFESFPEGQPTRIAPGLWVLRQPMLFNPGHINCYLIEDPKGLTIVDTGVVLPEAKANFQALFDSPLCKNGVQRIYLTHGHPDHVGMAQWLQEQTGAPIYVSKEEYHAVQELWRGSSDDKEGVAEFFQRWSVPAAQMGGVHAMLDGFKMGCPDLDECETIEIFEHQTFEIGDRTWKIVSGWGHTPHNSALYCEQDGIMLSGDQILPSIFPNVSIWYGSDSNPLELYLDSLQEQKLLSIQLVCPAHGSTLEEVNKRIDKIIEFNLARVRKAIEFCRDEARTAFDCIPPVMNKRKDHMLVSLVAGQVFAILSMLENKGIVKRCSEDVYSFQTLDLSDEEIEDRLFNRYQTETLAAAG
ncbi:MAG: hypothetical protein COB04_07540 [Gammaproteobacteria bacterium]|nr:MAG: hypothetical protein COB04_07540 [Gammaproteobacteria bacterium]